MKSSVHIVLAGLFFLSVSASGQSHLKTFGFDDQHVRSVTLPFDQVSNLIIIPVRVNNSEPLHMIFDTGVRTAILTELHTTDTLPFTYSQVQVLTGLGEGRSILAYPSYGNLIRLDGITGKNQDLYVLGQNEINLSMRLGTPVNGLMGYELLRDFVVEIDYIDKKLKLSDPSEYKDRSERRSVTLPLILDNGKPYIMARIVQENEDTLNVKLMLDTGGGFALWLSDVSDTLIKVPENGIRSYLGYGLGGEIGGSISRINSLIIGPYAFSMPIAAYPDSSAVKQVIRDEDRNGSLGAEILRRFDITLNYPDSSITLSPNSDFSANFSFNRTGIEVIAPFPGLNAYFVARVQPGSAADKAGIEVNDQIMQVNLRPAYECTMNDLNAYFHGKHGKKLKIRLLRNGQKIVVRFPLNSDLLTP